VAKWFIPRSKNKRDGTGKAQEHVPPHLVVGAGNENM
jgi:hypothetical protein